MRRGLDDLLAFLAVARERSFTKAAAKLIAERHDAGTDAKLVDQAIKEIAGR